MIASKRGDEIFVKSGLATAFFSTVAFFGTGFVTAFLAAFADFFGTAVFAPVNIVVVVPRNEMELATCVGKVLGGENADAVSSPTQSRAALIIGERAATQ